MPGDLGTLWNVFNYIFLVGAIWIINTISIRFSSIFWESPVVVSSWFVKST